MKTAFTACLRVLTKGLSRYLGHLDRDEAGDLEAVRLKVCAGPWALRHNLFMKAERRGTPGREARGHLPVDRSAGDDPLADELGRCRGST